MGSSICGYLTGNELADEAAKDALSQHISQACIPYTDSRPIVTQYIKDMFQRMWQEQVQNKLYQIKPVISNNLAIIKGKRRDQVVLTRCCIGHSRLTHMFLLRNEPYPECVACQCPLTIKHVLLECIDCTHPGKILSSKFIV